MPRGRQSRVTGVWEKVPGSGVWWVRYRVEGKTKRKNVSRKGDAIDPNQLPGNMRNATVRFKELAEAIRIYSASHHRQSRDVESKLVRVLPEFGERIADKVKPEEIDNGLTRPTS